MHEIVNHERLITASGLLRKRRPRVILVVGMPHSGKSSTLNLLTKFLHQPTAQINCQTIAPTALTQTIKAKLHLDHDNAPAVIALDDFDRWLEPAGELSLELNHVLTQLLEQPALTVLISSRVLPQSALLQRLMLHGECILLDFAHLALKVDDITALWQMEQTQQLDNEPDLIYQQTGGLALGVQLLCRDGLPAKPEVWSLLINDTLDHVAPHLEILARLAWLDPIDQGVAKAVVQNPAIGRLLQEWQHTGLIVNQVVHPLLAETLQQRLTSEELRQLVATAAAWYATHDQLPAAINLTRRTQQWDVLIEILDQASATFSSAFYPEVIEWLADVPRAMLTGSVTWLLAHSYVSIHDFKTALLLINEMIPLLTDPAQRRRLDLLKANIYQANGHHATTAKILEPYLHDHDLPVLDRARVLRISGIVQTAYANDSAAFDYLTQAYHLIEQTPPSQIYTMILTDYANCAARLGRYNLAEQLLDLAGHMWRELYGDHTPQMACVLNLQATIALQSARFNHAHNLAEQALSQDQNPRSVCGPLVTLGDIAVSQHNWQAAWQHYQAAREHASSDQAMLPQILAMLAQTACYLSQNEQKQILTLLQATSATTPLDQAWLMVGRASIYAEWNCALAEQAQNVQTTLEQLGGEGTLAHGLLCLLLSELHWRTHNIDAAQAAWRKLDDLLLNGRSGLPIVLEALALKQSDLINYAHTQWQSPFASRLYHTTHEQASPQLALHVLGKKEVYWHNKLVKIPDNGFQLLTLLVLAGSSGMDSSDLQQHIWRDGGSTAGFRKLLERVRAELPDIIIKDRNHYKLNIPFDAVEADVLKLKQTPLIPSERDMLHELAQLAEQTLLPNFDEPWLEYERRSLARRAAEIWFTLGNCEEDQHHFHTALNAYRTTLNHNPLHERAVIAGMTLALNTDQRSVALEIYEVYRRALYEYEGLDPEGTIYELYKRALG